MAHLSARLPLEVEIGAVRRDPDAEDVEVIRTDGGAEVRNVRTSQSLLEFDIAYPHSEHDAANFVAVRAAYKAARARLHSFDFSDHTEGSEENPVVDAVFGEGDGSTTVFNLVIPYTFGGETHERRIYRPVSAITIKKDGVTQGAGYSVNYSTGVVTFTVAPADGVELSWSGQFNVPVRFDTPLSFSNPAGHLVHVDTITLVEVRL